MVESGHYEWHLHELLPTVYSIEDYRSFSMDQIATGVWLIQISWGRLPECFGITIRLITDDMISGTINSIAICNRIAMRGRRYRRHWICEPDESEN